MNYGLKRIAVDRVFLDLKNPRHEPLRRETEAIAHLCGNENIFEIARDIVAHGLNPLELLGLIPDGHDAYIAVEGNRRLCALKLLRDPDRAPSEGERSAFGRVAANWEPVNEVRAIVFKDRRDAKLWLERIHAGFAGGRGRRSWNAEQKTRHTGYRKNLAAQKVLDAGQKRGFITRAARKGRISTVQRYLSNPVFRHVLGLNVVERKNVTTVLAEQDFHVLLKRFIEDVGSKRLHTRHRKSDIESYANRLSQTPDLTGIRTEPRPVQDTQPADRPTPRGPRRPSAPARIAVSEEIETALEALGNFKLQRLYFSLCKLRLSDHTPLLTVGMWVFLETLTALVGRNRSVAFSRFLNIQQLEDLGLGGGRETKALREAVQRLSENGNTTKHDQTAAAFNAEMLANDVVTMEAMLIALAKKAASRR